MCEFVVVAVVCELKAAYCNARVISDVWLSLVVVILWVKFIVAGRNLIHCRHYLRCYYKTLYYCVRYKCTKHHHMYIVC